MGNEPEKRDTHVVEDMVAALRTGLSYRQAAARFGCSVGKIASLAKAHGLARAARPPEAKAPARPRGRPRPDTAPNLPWHQIDRELVEGLLVATPTGATRRYKTYRELGVEHGVSHTIIARYARAHRCRERRGQNMPASASVPLSPPVALAPASPPSVKARADAIRHRLLDNVERDLAADRVDTHIFANILALLQQIDTSASQPTAGNTAIAALLERIARSKPFVLEQQRLARLHPEITGAVDLLEAPAQAPPRAKPPASPPPPAVIDVAVDEPTPAP